MALEDGIRVELEDGRLVRLLLSNNWKSEGSPDELAAAISGAIHDALPAPDTTSTQSSERPRVRHLTPGERHEHMAMHRDYLQRSLELSRRVAAGEFRGEPLPPDEENSKVVLRFSAGRFREVLIDPRWAAEATTNSIMEAVLQAFSDVDLAPEPPATREVAALREERARIREFAQA